MGTTDRELMSAADVGRTVARIAHQIIEKPALDADDSPRVVLLGIPTRGVDLATRLASRFGCPALEARPVATTGTPPARPGPPQGSPPPTTSTKPTEPPPRVLAPSNLTGICDRSIQPRIDGAMAGTLNINDVLTVVEPKLWAMATVLPIMQDTTIVAAGPSVQNVSLTGAVPVGIVGDAGRWVKTAP